MSEILEAIVLGIVQGLTEFLPVSSSGHLEIAKYLLGDDRVAEQSLLFTIVVHLATAIATLIIFRKEVVQLLTGLFTKEDSSRPYTGKIILSMLPAVFVGLFFEEAIEALFSQQLVLVGGALLVTAALLALADRVYQADREVTFKDALLIGIAQAVAIIPGISRSGATIATAVLLRVERESAARFSFLMVVPLIFGKICKDLIDGDFAGAQEPVALAVGFVAALLAGLLACIWMMALVKKAQLKYFSIYCVVVGILAIVSQS